jgi:hypothetical protein
MDHLSFIIPAAIAVIGGFAGITGFYGKSRGDTVISLLKDEIDHYIRENAVLKEENAALQSSDKAKSEQIVTLTKLAQGSPQLEALTVEIRNLVKIVRKANT